ncbi:MAG: ATP-grasp domain-containing protein [Candidatus Saccharimonadales bacterium]
MPVIKKLGTAELLFRSAQRLGLEPSWIVPRGLFAVTRNGKEEYINLSRSSINSHVATSLASNKHLTRLILERHGMANIPFQRPTSYADAVAFLHTHHTIVAKPLQGSGSRDIHIITRAEQLNQLTIEAYILEKYITGAEMRYLILNESVIAVHRSEYGTSVDENRHLERFSVNPTHWDPVLVADSIKTANILGLNFSAIDYLIGADGTYHILEVNSTPGLKWFHAPSEGPAVDVATMFLQALMGTSNGAAPDAGFGTYAAA